MRRKQFCYAFLMHPRPGSLVGACIPFWQCPKPAVWRVGTCFKRCRSLSGKPRRNKEDWLGRCSVRNDSPHLLQKKPRKLHLTRKCTKSDSRDVSPRSQTPFG